MRSGPSGAQLVLVTADAAQAGRLRVAASGDALGQRHRWLSPTTDGRRLLEVHTPHIGGVSHNHRVQGNSLIGFAMADGLSTHRIGSRELDLAVWLGSKLVLPSQDGTGLCLIDLRTGLVERRPDTLPAPMALTIALADVQGMAALLEDGRVLSWPMP